MNSRAIPIRSSVIPQLKTGYRQSRIGRGQVRSRGKYLSSIPIRSSVIPQTEWVLALADWKGAKVLTVTDRWAELLQGHIETFPSKEVHPVKVKGSFTPSRLPRKVPDSLIDFYSE